MRLTVEPRKSPRTYWLGISLLYGVSLSVLMLAPGLWPVVFVPGAILFLVLQAVYYGQIGRKIQGKFARAAPGVGAIAMIGGAIAILLRRSDLVYWAGPLVSVAGFIGMFLFLNRFGQFYFNPSEDPR